MANLYRKLQKHLNKQAVGYPRTLSSIDIDLLEYLFTKKEWVYVALNLSFRPQNLETLYESIQNNKKTLKYDFNPNKDKLSMFLGEMVVEKCIGLRERDGMFQYSLVPYYEGLFELQTGNYNKKFKELHKKLGSDPMYQLSVINIYPSQHRTIPIESAITPNHYVAPFNDIKKLINGAIGPFYKIPCPCREMKTDENHKCEISEDYHVCIVMGDLGTTINEMDIGIEIKKEEVFTILKQNQEAGLVLQPSGYKNIDSICSCCSCCCGLLGMMKGINRPADYWTSDYFTKNNPELCTSCGICKSKCPANAIKINGHAHVDITRCIGCGICVPNCPEEAMVLVHKNNPREIPETRDDLAEEIYNNRASFLKKIQRYNKMRKGKQWI